MTRSKRTAVLLISCVFGMVLVVSSPALLLFGRLEYDSVKERRHRLPFESRAWNDPAQIDGSDPVRIRMVDDLISSRRLDGLTRNEVEQLLGERTVSDTFAHHSLTYWLGPERGFMGIDSEWLAIDFGTDGRVSKYQIVRD
ncbi:hypothetical protein [Candidatus Korobacter versatilis]|nr:hypothetical protein [Candidatus Koribacter versatilis]